MAKQKHIKQVKSYSLPPDQIAWLRARAAQETTPEKTVSASNVLERIIDAAMDRTKKQLPSLQNPKTKKASNRLKHSQPGITHDGLKVGKSPPPTPCEPTTARPKSSRQSLACVWIEPMQSALPHTGHRWKRAGLATTPSAAGFRLSPLSAV